jgi:hypothetical protein
MMGAYLVGNILIGRILHLSSGYTAATWPLFMTAPSFSVPVFARPRNERERAYISTTIALYTVVTFIAAAVILMVYPVLG